MKKTKEELLKRQAEINEELKKVNEKLELHLDENTEEQAIEVEQEEVYTTMESNLRTELDDIEFQLAELDQK